MSSSNSTSSFALDYRPLPAQFQDCSATPSKRRHPLLHSCQQKPQRHPHVRNPHSHPQQQPALPRTITIMAFIHILCLCLCALSTLANAGDQEDRATRACFHLPRTLDRTCACSPMENGGVAFSCKGLNNTEAFDLELEETETKDEYEVRGNDILGGSRFPEEYRQLLWEQVMSIEVTDSAIRAVKMSDFARYRHLAKLSVTGSKVSQFLIDGGRAEASRVQRVGRQRDGKTDLTLLRLETLDLSLNELTELDAESLGELTHLKTINVSGNALHQLSPVFGSLEQLEVLDLSSNQLDESLNPKVLQDLPKSLKYLDISKNSWICSPSLSWIYAWSLPYVQSPSPVLRQVDKTRCRYPNYRYDGQLLLVMEYYSKYVTPTCPSRDNCTCLLTSVQEKIVLSKERVYSVRVDCAGYGLTHFPKLPKHTRTVDLSGNLLDSEAFSILKVNDHNYDEVDNLTLDRNKLETLPEKLLEMKLGLSFSAKHNQLTSIPYDFSQRLVKTTAVIKLSNNPWKCTCRSQITDLNLIAKVRDKNEMICGPGSTLLLEKKRIDEINPEILCPPESNGEGLELGLQILCVIMALLLAALIFNLSYDYYFYRKTGKLPNCALFCTCDSTWYSQTRYTFGFGNRNGSQISQ